MTKRPNAMESGRPGESDERSFFRMLAEDDSREPPPYFKSWNRLYLAIVVYTAILILLLYWLTRALDGAGS